MNKTHEIKPTASPKLAILSSHRTSAPVTYSQRSKPTALPKLCGKESVSSLRSTPLTTELDSEIPDVVLPTNGSSRILQSDNLPSRSQDLLSESFAGIPSTLHIPHTLWEPSTISQTPFEIPTPPSYNAIDDITAYEHSYTNLSSCYSEDSFLDFNKQSLLESRVTSNEPSFLHSSSSRFPAIPTISSPVTEAINSNDADNVNTVESEGYLSSHLSLPTQHIKSPMQNMAPHGILATLSVSVENMFERDLPDTHSKVYSDVLPRLASKSTQYLSRQTQSMPIRRFSAMDINLRRESTPPTETMSPSRQSLSAISKVPEVEFDVVTEEQADHSPIPAEEVILDSHEPTSLPDHTLSDNLPLLVQGMEIKLPDIKMHKPTRKLAPPQATEDRSIHQFCLSSKSYPHASNTPYSQDPPTSLIGMRYHRRPKLLYPLWTPSSPKYSVNRGELSDTLYPLYTSKLYSQHSGYYQEYFQDNLMFQAKQTRTSVFDSSLERAIKHEFSSLNDIPSATSKPVPMVRTSSQPCLACNQEEDSIFAKFDSSNIFDQINLQKVYIDRIKKDHQKEALTQITVLDPSEYKVINRKFSYDPRRSPPDDRGKHSARHSISSSYNLSQSSTKSLRRFSNLPKFVTSLDSQEYAEVISSVPLVEIEDIPALTAEVEAVDAKLRLADYNETRSALLLCQKGIILYYIGRLTEAYDCFSSAIELESGYGEALWYRAIVSYVNGLNTPALRDLLTLLVLNPRHTQAYKLRGILYNDIGLFTNALQDFSSALSLNPYDTHALLLRSEIYEKSGDTTLAMEDLKLTAALDKSNTLVLFKTVNYQFSKTMYQSALDNLTVILHRDPCNIEALCLRGRCHFMLRAYFESLKDYSAAIHYDPTSFMAFYYRGCVLRRANPWLAIRDLSTAIVLDVNNNNAESILLRAIAYRSLKLIDEAFSDLSIYIKLRPNAAIGHTILGLMHHKHKKDFNKAVYYLTLSIGLDPLNARVYACRGDAYFCLSEMNSALLDYSRASHLSPDDTNYHILRGKVLLHMEKMSLAKNHLHYSRKLTPGDKYAKSHTLHSSILQLVVVENFLGRHEDALELLQESSRGIASFDTFVLLGKTLIKLKNYQDAMENLTIAKRLLTNNTEIENKHKKTANVLFLQGICAYSLGRNSKAIELLTESLSCYPQSHETYYVRGLASIKSPHNKKGILDLNKSLALNNRFFQAYLARAAYYCMEGRVSKAILNCNEAIELENDSIRGYFYRGTLRYFLKSYSAAIQDLTHTISLDPSCYLAYYNRAKCYFALGSHQEAISDYTTAQELLIDCKHTLSPDNIIEAKIVQNRGLIYFKLREYVHALDDFKFVAMDLAVRDKLSKKLAIPLYQATGISLHRLGQVNQAVNYMKLMLELDITCIHGYIGRATVYMDYMNKPGYQLSKNDFCRALHLDPTCVIARINLAFLLQFEGKYAQAWCHLTNVLESDPTNPHALEARAIICLQMKDTFAATLDIDRAITGNKSAQILNSAGLIYFYSRYPKQAMEFFIAATKLDPTYQLAYFNAGTLLLINKLYLECDETFSKALLPNLPADEHTLINRSVARLLLGRKKDSLEDLKMAKEHNPNFSHIYVNKAYHYLTSGDTESAQDCYQKALEVGSNNSVTVECVIETLQNSHL